MLGNGVGLNGLGSLSGLGSGGFPHAQGLQSNGYTAWLEAQAKYEQAHAQYAAAIQPQVKVEFPPTQLSKEPTRMRTIKFLFIYALVGIATFSWLYKHQVSGLTGGDREFVSVSGGLFWPVYWAGKIVFVADDAITAATAPAPAPSCRDDAGNTWRVPFDGICWFSHQ